MTDAKGLLDTSVVLDHDLLDPALLPDEAAISAVTIAELAAGPHATDDPDERARRQDRLQWAAATCDPLPLDADAAAPTAASLRRRAPRGVPARAGSRIC